MTVEVLEPHGFCSGVESALRKAVRARADFGEGLCCLHELVHNGRVVEDLRTRGVRFVESLREVPDGGVVLFSAHGVPPETRAEAERRGLTVIDATCPFVARAHQQVVSYAARGVPVVVVGHAGHVEVEGIVGEARAAGARVAVVADSMMVAGLEFTAERAVGAVCQTTFGMERARSVLDALRARYPLLETAPAAEVCTATRDRQDAVRTFVARGGDGVLVLGSATSSNTRRLAEVAAAAGAKVWRVADAAELAACSFAGIERLGVTSGASTPEEFLVEVVHELQGGR